MPTENREGLQESSGDVPQTYAEALAVVVKLGEDLLEAHEALIEYADHQSWRCGHPDRYPWEPDCPCGLVSTLKGFGIATHPVAGKSYA